MKALARLEEIGFRKVGTWSPGPDGPVVAIEPEAAKRNVLYAFVCEGQVLYVGKTAMLLAKRLYGYQRPGPTQRTNAACNKHIRELLAGNRQLEVYSRGEEKVSQIGSFTVSQAAALEDAIIRDLQPPWNRMGK
jgi:hypothetical protein